MRHYDAIVVGGGPNGLAAAITLARARRKVLLLEANETVGGGASSAELTLPGFIHDLGSAIHPLALGAPFLSRLPLAGHGLHWIQPPAPLAHPFDGGTAVVVERSLEATVVGLGRDGPAYQWLMEPVASHWPRLAPAILGPLRPPRHPLTMGRFGLRAPWPARLLATSLFRDQQARGLLAGLCAHAALPLEHPPSAAVGLVLGGLAHAVGWPLPRGGAQSIANALAGHLRALGGEIVTGQRVESLEELPPAKAILCAVTPRQLLRMAGTYLPDGYRRALGRYRYGPGVFKVDWALEGPIPWDAAACRRAATVHLGGTLDEIAAAERAPWQGTHSALPYVLLTQPSLFDPTRAPAGKHTAWAYCHVPHGSSVDMTAAIEAQVERFAPGFRTRILGRHVMGPAALEAYDANLVGGDILGGVGNLRGLVARPTLSLIPYATARPGLYICSAATPPGAGVHGMCGYHAARAVLRAGL